MNEQSGDNLLSRFGNKSYVRQALFMGITAIIPVIIFLAIGEKRGAMMALAFSVFCLYAAVIILYNERRFPARSLTPMWVLYVPFAIAGVIAFITAVALGGESILRWQNVQSPVIILILSYVIIELLRLTMRLRARRLGS